MKKNWWESKTIWLNMAVAIGAVIEANFALLQTSFGPKLYVPIIGLVAGTNFLLRFFTTQPIVEPKVAPGPITLLPPIAALSPTPLPQAGEGSEIKK